MCCEECVRKINEKDVALFRKKSVHEFSHLKALITLEQVNTSVVEEKKDSLGVKLRW